MDKNQISHLILRLGVAFAFIYAALAGFISPENWIGYFPSWTKNLIPGNFLLFSWGIIEIVLALWIISGKKILIPSIIGALSLFGLIVFNFNQMDVLFRDVTILLALIALALNPDNAAKSPQSNI